MNGLAASRLAHWWVYGLNEVDRARPLVTEHTTRAIARTATREKFAAALVARVWRWAARTVKRLGAQRQPQSPQELLAYARSIEQTMPNLAAELRYFACKG